MAVQTVTKPPALDETLQDTNTALGNVNTNIQAIGTAVGGVAKDTTLQATNTAIGTQNSKLDTVNTKLQAIVDALGSQSLIGDTDISQIADGTVTGAIAQFDSDISDLDTAKADKVSGATNGNLAGIDSNGNLTDSGWNGAKDTTSISGNPISISGLKSNQLAVNPIITLEPIQAGSGTPSPSNIRAISGYDKIEVLSCGKNILPLTLDDIKKASANASPTGSWSGNIWSGGGITIEIQYDNYGNVSGLKANGTANQNVLFIFAGGINLKYTQYTFSGCPSGGAAETYRMDARNMATSTMLDTGEGVTFQATTGNNGYVLIRIQSGTSVSNLVFKPQLEESATKTTFEPYHKATDFSESLGQTVYGATWYPRTGKFIVDRAIYKVNASDITFNSSTYIITTSATLFKPIINDEVDYYISTHLKSHINSSVVTMNNEFTVNSNKQIVIRMPNTITTGTQATDYFTNNDVYIVALLATPFTIQLTPHEVSLLKDYAYVSTNGTNIALDYHNGELASLADVSQLGETVNELGDYVNGKIKYDSVTGTTDSQGLLAFGAKGKISERFVIGAHDGTGRHIFIPFVYDTQWGAKVLSSTNGNPVTGTSITAQFVYIDLTLK